MYTHGMSRSQREDLAVWGGVGMFNSSSLRDVLSPENCTSTALILYEYILTLDDELDLIWRRKMSASSLIFLANRVTVIVYTVGLALMFSGPDVSNLLWSVAYSLTSGSRCM